MSTLVTLARIILDGAEKIEADCAARGEVYPTLNSPYNVQTTSVQNRCAAEAATVIAAAKQLAATLSHPYPHILRCGFASYLSTSLAAVDAGCVSDILREAGCNGLHVNDIAGKNHMDVRKLERIMRFLTSHNIFNEVSPSVFSNNRISAALSTGKPVEAILANSLNKWDDTNGVGAMAGFLGIEGIKGAAYLTETLTDPITAGSDEPNKASISRAFNMELPMFALFSEPKHAVLPASGFEWSSLPAQSVIVDVGGGIGTVTMNIAAKHEHLRFIIQDLPAVIALAKQHWQTQKPEKVASGAVTLQEHNFFDEQPVKGASVYVLRYILHNWPDHYCSRFLQRLRDAAQPSTRLVVWDELIEHLSYYQPLENTTIPGAAIHAVSPILPHPEAVAGLTYDLDVLMMACFNSQERTVGHFKDLCRQAGWELERVYRFMAPHPQQLIFAPI